MTNTINIMLDLETLGLKPGCPIISIGAVTFRTRTPIAFYVVIDPATQEVMNEPNKATLEWWSAQSPEARKEVFDNPNAISLKSALESFVKFVYGTKNSPADIINIWGKGASFDEPIIIEALERHLLPVPWKYSGSMCFRTLEALGKQMNVAVPAFTGTKHSAIDDATHQAACADAIFNRLIR